MRDAPNLLSEPAAAGLTLIHEHGRSLQVRYEGRDLLRYVYAPWDPQFESPRPYFHPINTLGGRGVSMYRPHDHVWHKGLVWSLPNVGTENFWGGPTYNRGRGYEQLDNNGSMLHTGFESITATENRISVVENLDWVSQAGRLYAREQRSFSVALLPSEQQAWVLTYGTRFTNESGQVLELGSPTTKGRENAGYGGLFWRGPRSFTGGRVYAPGVSGGDELNGIRAPWLAFSGEHDGDGGASTMVFVDSPRNSYPEGAEHTEWFVRTGIYAVISASPFYSQETRFQPGAELNYEYALVVADHDRGVAGAGELAEAGSRILQAPDAFPAAPEAADHAAPESVPAGAGGVRA